MEQRKKRIFVGIFAAFFLLGFLVGTTELLTADTWVNGSDYLYPNDSYSQNVTIYGNLYVNGTTICTNITGIQGEPGINGTNANSFDQSLNTTDNVTFNSISSNGSTQFGSWWGDDTDLSITVPLSMDDQEILIYSADYNGTDYESYTITDIWTGGLLLLKHYSSLDIHGSEDKYLESNYKGITLSNSADGNFFVVNKDTFSYKEGNVCTDTNGLCTTPPTLFDQSLNTTDNVMFNIVSVNYSDPEAHSQYAGLFTGYGVTFYGYNDTAPTTLKGLGQFGMAGASNPKLTLLGAGLSVFLSIDNSSFTTTGKVTMSGIKGTGKYVCYNTTDDSLYRNSTCE